MKKRLIVVGIISVVVLIGLILMMKKHSGDHLIVNGTIEATTVTVGTKVPGRLLQRLVDEGAVVTKGQILASIDPRDASDERAIRRADLVSARAAVADLKAGSRSEEIRAAQATVVRLQAEAHRSEQDAVRSEALYRKEVIPRRELDQARAARQGAAAAVREAEEHLALLRRGSRVDTIRQAEARIVAAEAALSLAETKMREAQLSAPMNGVVLTKHAEPGELLSVGAPVVTIARLDEVWVRGYIPEPSLGAVRVGQTVSVYSDSWKNKPLTGTISFIASEAEFTPRAVQTESERVKLMYRIKVVVANPDQRLKPGMPVDITITPNR